MNSRTRKDADRSATVRRVDRQRAQHASPASNGSGTAQAGQATSSAWHAVESPIRLQMLEAILTRPGATARELADALGTSPPRLHYHLNILRDAGLIRPAPVGRSRGKGPAAIGFVATDGEFLARASARAGQHGKRLAFLLAETAAAGFAAAGQKWQQSEPSGPRNFVRCGHEALAPQEVEAVWAHLKQIEAIVQRARERRRRAGALVGASTFVGLCLAATGDPRLPDGFSGWESGNGHADGRGQRP